MHGKFLIKRFVVGVVGYGDAHFFAKNKNQARMKAFNSLQGAGFQISFKEYLKKVSFIADAPMPSGAGKKVLVLGSPAFYVAQAGGNSVYFVRPDSDQIMISHESDAEDQPNDQ